MKQKRFFAEWHYDHGELPEEVADSIDQFHISCGVGDHQSVGYFPSAKGAKLTFERSAHGWKVRLEVPTEGLEKEKDYWLSPNGENGEASNFGLVS